MGWLNSLSSSLAGATAEVEKLSAMTTPVDTKQSGQTSTTSPPQKVTRTQKTEVIDRDNEHGHGLIDSLSSTVSDMLGSGGDLMQMAAKDLTSVDVNVNAGGNVAVDGTLTTNSTASFALDRNSILYSALATFVAMELFQYLNR